MGDGRRREEGGGGSRRNTIRAIDDCLIVSLVLFLLLAVSRTNTIVGIDCNDEF